MATRAFDTVRVFRSADAEKINQLLEREGIATAFFEVEWWNSGRRSASGVELEIAVPGKIVAHDIKPAADDLGAGWSAYGPHDTSQGQRLRIRQDKLMPGGQCNVVIGYLPLAGVLPECKAYLADRPVPRARDQGAMALLTVPIVFLAAIPPVSAWVQSFRPWGTIVFGLAVSAPVALMLLIESVQSYKKKRGLARPSWTNRVATGE